MIAVVSGFLSLALAPRVAPAAEQSRQSGGPRHAISTTEAPAEVVTRALVGATAAGAGACTERLRASLVQGEDLLVGQERALCQQERARVTRRMMRLERREFGVVEQREDSPGGVTMVLSVAERCRRWPLRGGGREVLKIVDTQELGCRLRRLEAPLPVDVTTVDGQRYPALLSVPANFGHVAIDFVAIDRALRERGLAHGLDAVSRLELGVAAWAGEVDLERARQVLTEAHLRWVRVGRGVPALFVARHPDHPAAAEVRALANEADLHRQERDFQAVLDGRITPLKFLERHPASSYELEVRARVELGDAAVGRGARLIPGPSSQLRVVAPGSESPDGETPAPGDPADAETLAAPASPSEDARAKVSASPVRGGAPR